MATESVNYQCPSCMGPLHFEGADGKLHCDYCGGAFTPAEVEAAYAAKQQEADAKAESDTERAEAGRLARGLTQAQLADAVGLTEGAIRHYESGIRAVKPELLEEIAKALEVSAGALKDYGVETSQDLMALLLQLEEGYGLVPSEDGMGLAVDPRAPHAPKLARSIKSWAEKRAELERGELDEDAYADWKASFCHLLR